MKAVKGKVYGNVQGVGFRMYTYRQADRLGIAGWVKNNSDGSVTFHCEGSDVDISFFLDLLKRGNDFSQIDRVETEESELENLTSFEVIG